MKRKKYRIILMCNMTHVLFSKSNNDCGSFIDIYLTDEEYNKIKDIQYDEFIKNFNQRRTTRMQREVIMHQLYKKARWLFEDEESI